MAGRISEADIAAIKSRVNIVDVIADHVTLKRAGTDSLKGLCPFHDERTPSFTVSLNMGRYHCFGCQESGDAISFLMNYQHLSFIEAVEQLAERVNYTITYEEGGAAQQGPKKTRLFAANRAASEYFQQQLQTPAGTVAREFMESRGFNSAALAHFEIGYAPDSWNLLTEHLQAQGFSTEELLAAGLVSQGSRGVYDRFRARPVWPIKDASGQVIGFGARKLLDNDQGPKYLNSPETPVYHKSQVLYGIELAKKAIARDKRAIVVEGYTDVMACHLAGIENAVATCGTAFGPEHIAVLRRILGDDASSEVIFTFDPDSAGQAAALKAYGEEKRFNAQTYVATNAAGLDPSDLRQQLGDEALRAMFTQKTPLFEFALRHAVAGYDLNSVAGRHQAIANAVPIILGIRDHSLHPAYARELARMVGAEVSEVQQQMQRHKIGNSLHNKQQPSYRRPKQHIGHSVSVNYSSQPDKVPVQQDSEAHVQRSYSLLRLPRDPHTRLERDALMAMLQRPQDIGQDLLVQAVAAWIDNEPLRLVRDAIANSVAYFAAPQMQWLEAVIAAADPQVQILVRELALQPLPELKPERAGRYAQQVVISLLLRDLKIVKDELLRRMQRIGNPQDPASRQIQEHMLELEKARRELQALTGA